MELTNVNIVSVESKTSSGGKPYHIIKLAEHPDQTFTYWHTNAPTKGPVSQLTYKEQTKGDKVFRNIESIQQGVPASANGSAPAQGKSLTEIIGPEMTKLLIKHMDIDSEAIRTPTDLAKMHREMVDAWRKPPKEEP
jgi:hypothetical protein